MKVGRTELIMTIKILVDVLRSTSEDFGYALNPRIEPPLRILHLVSLANLGCDLQWLITGKKKKGYIQQGRDNQRRFPCFVIRGTYYAPLLLERTSFLDG